MALDLQRLFPGQTVKDSEMRLLQVSISAALSELIETLGLGNFPVSGLEVSADAGVGAEFRLGVTAGWGVADYTDTGADADADAAISPAHALQPYGTRKRTVRLAASASIDVDEAELPAAGKERWVLLGLQHSRTDSMARTGDDEATIYYYGKSVGALALTYGDEVTSPATSGDKPAVPTDVVPLAYVLLTNGMTEVAEKDLDRSIARPSYARQWADSGDNAPGGVPGTIADLAALTLDNYRVYAEEPASLNVKIRPGRINTQSGIVSSSTTQTQAIAAPSSGQTRVALVYLDPADGSPGVTYGDAVAIGGSPEAPSHVGVHPLAHVTLENDGVVSTKILPSNVQDVRPFQRADYLPWNEAYLEAGVDVAVGETTIPLPFTYTQGINALWVWRTNNTLYTPGTESLARDVDYSETVGGASIVLADPLQAGDVLVVRAMTPSNTASPTAHASSHAAGGSDPITDSNLNGHVLDGFESYTTGDNEVTIEPFAAYISGVLRASTEQIVKSSIGTGNDAEGLPFAEGWYRLYAYWTGSAVAVEVSSTPVTNTGATRNRTKNGDTSRTYLGSIYYTSAGSVRRFRRRNRRVEYMLDENVGSPSGDVTTTTISADTGGAVVSGARNADNVFPPHVRYGSVRAILIPGAGLANLTPAGATISGYPYDDTADPVIYMRTTKVTNAPQDVWMVRDFVIHMNANRQITVSKDADVDLYLMGTGYDD